MYEKEEHILKVLPPRNCLKKSDWFKIAIHYSYIHMSHPQAATKKRNTITYILFFSFYVYEPPFFLYYLISTLFLFFVFWMDFIDVLICFILYSFFLYFVFLFHSFHSSSSPKFISILIHAIHYGIQPPTRDS